jgi:hypothetical protein
MRPIFALCALAALATFLVPPPAFTQMQTLKPNQAIIDQPNREQSTAAGSQLGDICTRRAKDAAGQNQINQKLGCGFKGSQWSSDFQAHFKRCQKIGAREEMRNYKKRLNDLNACRARKASKKGESRESFCNKYADQSMAHYQRNVQYKCGYKARGWESARKAHYQWCMDAGNSRANQLISYREKQLKDCQALYREQQEFFKNKKGYCPRYAKRAVAQNEENKKAKCGFWGTNWHSNETIHRDWCLGNRAGDPPKHIKARENQLQECRELKVYCPKYARKAVAQNQENKSKKCGFWGPKWHSNEKTHRNWCLKAKGGVFEAQREVQKREIDLQKCRRKNR